MRGFTMLAACATLAATGVGCASGTATDSAPVVVTSSRLADAGDPPSSPSTTTTPPEETTAPSSSAPPVTTTTTTAAPSTTVPGPRQVSMAFTGDILVHSPLWRQAGRNADAVGAEGFDFEPMLARLAPVLDSVDLAVCHLETPFAPAGEELSTYPLFGVPAEVAEAIVVAGYEHCSTASNHTVDRGTAGIDRTIEVLESHGIGQTGMARTPAEIEPRLLDVAGVAVSHLSYTFSYNGLRLPEGEEWRSALIDPERIAADVDKARAIGAEVVVVSLHWGEEKIHRPSYYQRNVAEALTALGTIDLIVGHHAHVLQPIEQVNGTWVVFGLGNVLSNMPTSDNWPLASGDAAVVTVEVEVSPDGVVTVERPVAHPTWVDKHAGWEAVLVLDELARDDISDGYRGQLERSLTRTIDVMGDHVAAG